MFKAKPFVGAVAGVAALSAVAFFMLSNSSPYVTIAQAKTMNADNLHVEGNLVKESLQVDTANAIISFTLTDKHGEEVHVVHNGLPPANMGEATKVVVVGGMKGDRFQSRQLLTKCPSKYESEKKPKPALD